jgi:hypothetical protein
VTQGGLQPAGARVGRVVVHAGSDPRAAQRIVQRLPSMLNSELAAHEIGDRRDLERLVRRAAREARA